MKKILLIISTMIFLSACTKKGKPIDLSQYGDFQLELLFEHDSCKVYRFVDGGRCIYWSDCRGKIQADYTTQAGKTTVTHHEETITTK